MNNSFKDVLLPGLPVERIHERYAQAPGNEIDAGKFASPESSAALVANAFGLFLDQPDQLPIFLKDAELDWPPLTVTIEAEVRFPWNGGSHPWLDVLIETSNALIGVESKRYEPFRTKNNLQFSEAYWRPVWGQEMNRFNQVRDGLQDGSIVFKHLNATQLVKHAYGLRTAVHRQIITKSKLPILVYLYAEPKFWSDGRKILSKDIHLHQQEIADFAEMVRGEEVKFLALSYQQLLDTWRQSPTASICTHADAINERFAP